MAAVGAILFWIITVWLIAIFILVIALNTTPSTPPSDEPIQIPGLGPCKPIEDLVDVSDELCCVIGGQKSTTRYSFELDAVVGPTATLWTQACDTLMNNDEIQQCYIDLQPDACNSKAASVARVGVTKYYVRNFGDGGCTTRVEC